jgi:hypothetical protein
MKLPEIKKLVDNYSLEELELASNAIENGNLPLIQIGGDDEGEHLTHTLAAIWIMKNMRDCNMDFRASQREYVKIVRNTIV